MRNRILSLILTLSVVFSLLLSTSSPIVAHAEGEIILIESAEDFIDFAKNCSYNLWSRGKTLFLTKDIDLSGKDFDTVPVFSGVFEGNNHTIKGINVTSATSPTGLFAILEKDGVIRNLNVVGVVTPDGDANTVGGVVGENYGTIEKVSFIGSVIGATNVGGIAGVNRLSGSIIGCLAGGEIIGESAVGGIAGRNEGLISSATSTMKVNTVSITPSLSLDDINLSLTIDITKLPGISGTTTTDIGGIAGYSTGIILSCINNGKVGYPHIGYNIGGIAGRSSGHLSGCINNAEINGRKDVGGVVGQMEPYVNYNLSEDILASLKSELDRLSGKVNAALDSTGSGTSSVSTRLDNLITNLEGATGSLDLILGDLGEYGGDMTDEVNRIGVILKETLTMISSVTSELPELAKILSDSLTDIEAALDDIDSIAVIGVDTLFDMIELVENASLASESIKSALNNLADGIELFKEAINISDQAKAEDALDDILSGLFAIVDATDVFAEKIQNTVDAIGDNMWMNSLIDSMDKMAGKLSNLSASVTTIYESVITIKDNISIHWDEIENAGEEMIAALDRFTASIKDIDDGLALMESGLDKVTRGVDGIVGALSVNDAETVKKAAEGILGGIADLVNAAAGVSEAIGNLSEAFSMLEDGDDLTKIFGALSDAMDGLADTGSDSAEAFSVITENLKALFDNIDLDIDALGNSGALIWDGVSNVTASLRKMRSAISNMSLGMDAINNAVSALGQAIVIEDQAKIDEAMADLSAAISALVYSTEEITNILGETVDIMREAKIWSDRVIDSLSDLAVAAREITSAITGIKDGIDDLRDSVSLDLNSMKGGLEKTVSAIRDTANASEHIKNALLNLSDVFVNLQGATEKVSDLAKNLSAAVTDMAKALNVLGIMAEDINELVSYLMNVDAIQLPTPPESITDETNKLFIYISKIESELKLLNSDATSMSNELIKILGEMNDVLANISDKMVEIIYDLENGDILDNDVSEKEIDSITNGKVFSCRNNGRVEGDINVGGISGVMGLEYTLDPEDDLSPEVTVTQKKQYRLKAVIHASKNYGEVVSKYDGAGGITGKMDFGLIYRCESYGNVSSTSGSYVGGIAGIAAGRISSSFVKCELQGTKYVGGIVGSGITESFAGDSSMVAGCSTMVNITRASQYFGAIAGANNGNFEENVFISDTLAGIDRVSYGGKAEPIGYEELIKRRSIPDGFYGFTLKFVADGVVLHSLTFQYGDSISDSEYPEIPKKDGHYGEWDINELNNLTFDTVVSVIYTPYTTVIAGGERDEGGRNIFLVEGEFRTDDALTITKDANTDGLTLKKSIFVKDSLSESWVITIPEDGVEKNKVHFLPTSANTKIFLKTHGQWTEVESAEFGSYLVFEAEGDRVEIAAVTHTVNVLTIVILGGLVLIGAGVAVTICIINKKKSTPKEVEEN